MTETATAPAARFYRGEPVTILVTAEADAEYETCAPGGVTVAMLEAALPTRIAVPCDGYPGVDVIRGDIKPVLIAMARDALVARTLLNGCRVCETGHPCPECVIDVQRQREYGEILAALTSTPVKPHPG